MASQRLFRSLQRHLPQAIPRATTSLTLIALLQTRLFSNTRTLRGKVVHPDMDNYIRYSLRDGPPRTPRPKPLYSLFRQHSWPNTPPAAAATTKTPPTLATPTFISAFQPTWPNRRVSSSSSRTPEDLAQIESGLRQLKNLNSQVGDLMVLADDLNDRIGAFNKLSENAPPFRGGLLPWSREVLSQFQEDRRLQSQCDALYVIRDHLLREYKILRESAKKPLAPGTLSDDDDDNDNDGGKTGPRRIRIYPSAWICGILLGQIWNGVTSDKEPKTRDVEGDAASDEPHSVAEGKSEDDKGLQKLHYLARP